MDASAVAELVFGAVGGLGIFLLGMKHMSEGMQAVAGTGLRRMIAAVTDNRLLATGTGVLVTCTVQSSSVTTVMVIGFVNSGVMKLSQAIGVIMGANIGTTITGWILVLKIGKYGLPLLGAAALVYLFSRGDRARYWAMVAMGVGMIFFGLELMKDACSQIKTMPEFAAWFGTFDADTYLGVLGCALMGCILTVIVQSSSATLGITISMAYEGLIPFEAAAALVLGENIGTTVTAYLASLGATTNARRAAYFHMIFNLIGVFWITLIFPWYVELIQWLTVADVTQTVTENGEQVFPNVTAAIAATHSVFNVTNTLLFLPFVPMFARLLERLLPSKSFKEKPHLTDLDYRTLETPMLAIEQSRSEILKMGDGCSKMMDWLREIVEREHPEPGLAERLYRRENVLDSIQDEIATFVTNLLSANLPHYIAEEGRAQLRIADEYESISDYVASILKAYQRLANTEEQFSEREREGLLRLHEFVHDYLRVVNEAYKQQNQNVFVQSEGLSKRIRRFVKKLRRQHLDDLATERVAPAANIAFLAILNSYSRVRDHSQNIVELIAGEK